MYDRMIVLYCLVIDLIDRKKKQAVCDVSDLVIDNVETIADKASVLIDRMKYDQAADYLLFARFLLNDSRLSKEDKLKANSMKYNGHHALCVAWRSIVYRKRY